MRFFTKFKRNTYRDGHVAEMRAERPRPTARSNGGYVQPLNRECGCTSRLSSGGGQTSRHSPSLSLSPRSTAAAVRWWLWQLCVASRLLPLSSGPSLDIVRSLVCRSTCRFLVSHTMPHTHSSDLMRWAPPICLSRRGLLRVAKSRSRLASSSA